MITGRFPHDPASVAAGRRSRFRTDFRAWLASHLPFPPLPLDDDARVEFLSDWQRTLYDAGWMGASFPIDCGGRGLGPVFEAILSEELGAAGAASPFHYGYVARVLTEWGSPEQRDRFVRPALRGDERWCQGFSEPDAGSDLASIRTRAIADRTDYVITGQKVWTSRAHWSDWCFLLARTGDPELRHHGLSCLIVPTDAKGLTIRPFRQMTGGLEFAEVFLDEVRVSSDALVGEVGNGWAVAMSTVAYERGPADVGRVAELRRRVRNAAEVIKRRRLAKNDPLIEALALVHLDVEVLAQHVLRGVRERESGNAELSSTSIDKLLVTGTEQALADFEMRAFGADALLGRAPEVAWGYFEARAASIYGGTSQVQRNILANRVLGLPRA